MAADKILVAVDDTESSDAAFEFASKTADRLGAELHLVHVVRRQLNLSECACGGPWGACAGAAGRRGHRSKGRGAAKPRPPAGALGRGRPASRPAPPLHPFPSPHNSPTPEPPPLHPSSVDYDAIIKAAEDMVYRRFINKLHKADRPQPVIHIIKAETDSDSVGQTLVKKAQARVVGWGGGQRGEGRGGDWRGGQAPQTKGESGRGSPKARGRGARQRRASEPPAPPAPTPTPQVEKAIALVVASHNKGPIKQLFTGSVTKYVVANLRTPVVVVPVHPPA
jgi:hypothetical protein